MPDISRLRSFGAFIAVLISISVASACRGAPIHIDFQDQTNDGGPASSYTFNAGTAGLTSPLTVTFFGLNVSDPNGGDEFPGPGYPNFDNIVLYGDDTIHTPYTITFSQPVTSVSLHVSPYGTSSEQYSLTSIIGSLAGINQFTYTYPLGTGSGQLNDNTEGNYYLASGGGNAIDKLSFSNFQDMGVGDLTFNAPTANPEPGIGLFLVPAAMLLLLRRRGDGAKGGARSCNRM